MAASGFAEIGNSGGRVQSTAISAHPGPRKRGKPPAVSPPPPVPCGSSVDWPLSRLRTPQRSRSVWVASMRQAAPRRRSAASDENDTRPSRLAELRSSSRREGRNPNQIRFNHERKSNERSHQDRRETPRASHRIPQHRDRGRTQAPLPNQSTLLGRTPHQGGRRSHQRRPCRAVRMKPKPEA